MDNIIDDFIILLREENQHVLANALDNVNRTMLKMVLVSVITNNHHKGGEFLDDLRDIGIKFGYEIPELTDDHRETLQPQVDKLKQCVLLG